MLVKGKSYDLKGKKISRSFDFKVRFLMALSRMALDANRRNFIPTGESMEKIFVGARSPCPGGRTRSRYKNYPPCPYQTAFRVSSIRSTAVRKSRREVGCQVLKTSRRGVHAGFSQHLPGPLQSPESMFVAMLGLAVIRVVWD
jgi:hypothetical protein